VRLHLDVPTPREARILVVSPEVETSDRLQAAIAALGFEAVPAFSAGEAVGAVSAGAVDGIVLDLTLEEADALRRWLDRHYRGVVCLVQDLEAPDGHAVEEGEEVADADAVEVAARLLRGLSGVRTPRDRGH
jgi:CheY-like chemotaxis protein